MTTFDPWTATLEEAEKQPNALETRGPFHQCAMAQVILSAREEFERCPIDGIAQCVRASLVVPDWLAKAFLRQYDKVLNCHVATWDEAFGPAFASGKHLSTRRLYRQYGFRVLKLFTNDEFRGEKALPRTLAGRQKAAEILGISEKQVRTLMPKTRSNVKGHKPYSFRQQNNIQANDPFSLAATKVPKK
jgi:hypothetical protein